MNPPPCFDTAGQRLTLGAKLGEGGEGTVYALGGEAVKLYHRPLERHRQQKLAAMTAGCTPRLLQFAAWPTATVHDGPQRDSPVCGFRMPRVQGTPLHLHFSPTDRKERFPHEHWDYLVRVAQNLAAAMATLHRHGIVIGDVNENLFVVEEATSLVRLVDCDSFQLTAGSIRYPCLVSSPEFTPPELIGQALRTIERTPCQDTFGLAVLVFKLLLGGWHPFDGTTTLPVQIEQRISQGLYAYGTQGGITPPGLGVNPARVTPALVDLFRAAFNPPGGSRPSAAQWFVALQALGASLVQCQHEPAHKFSATVANCPWCASEAQGITHFFSPPRGTTGRAAFVAEKARRQTNLLAAQATVQRLQGQWHQHVQQQMGTLVAELHQAQERLQRLTQQGEVLKDRYLQARHAAYAQSFLALCRIRDAQIPGIGLVRIEALARNGIHTAADLTGGYWDVRGIGYELQRRLMDWRDACAQRIVLPTSVSDQVELQRIDDAVAQQCGPVAREVQRLEAEVQQRQTVVQSQLQDLHQRLQAATRAEAQAQRQVASL